MRISIKYYVLCIVGLLALSLPLIHDTFPIIRTVKAQCQTSNTNSRVSNGLISTPKLSGNLGSSTGNCVAGSSNASLPQAAIAPYTLPSYDDLKSLFFDQAKVTVTRTTIDVDSTNSVSQTSTNHPFGSNIDGSHVFLVPGTLNIQANFTTNPTGPGVIFVKDDLNIGPISGGKFTYTDNGFNGLVFVVKGNIYIDPGVHQIDAVLIAQGIICDFWDLTTPSNNPTSCSGAGVVTPAASPADWYSTPLTIYGSLIALDQSNPISFRRSLYDNSVAAEQVNSQAKYLVILRDLFTQPFTYESEDTTYKPPSK